MVQYEKKKYGKISNLLYIINLIGSWDVKYFIANLIKVPVEHILPMLTAFIPTVLLFLTENKFSVKTIVLCILLLTVVDILLYYCSVSFSTYVEIKNASVAKQYELMVVEKAMNISFELFEREKGRTAFQAARNSLYRIHVFFNSFLRLIVSVLGFSAICSVIIVLNPWVIAALIVVQLILLLFGIAAQKFENKGKKERAGIDKKLAHLTKESRDFRIAKDIRIFTMSNLLIGINETLIKMKRKSYTQLYNRYLVSDIINQFVGLLVVAGTYGYLFYKCVHSDMTVTEFSFFLTAVLSFDQWLTSVSCAFQDYNRDNYCITDFRQFIDLQEDTVKKNGIELSDNDFSRLPAELLVNNLNYTYEGASEPTLKSINVCIKPKEKIALVGPNGSGKTTFVKLLCGLYSCKDGSIYIDGVDINKYDSNSVYKMFTAVFQDPVAIPASIAQNIAADDRIDPDRIRLCVDLSGLSDRVNSLEEKENTLLIQNVFQNAVELSGGEMQKLMLARALYKNAPFIILDEPTASLDPIAEQKIYQKYNVLFNDKTSIYISHRLSSTTFCDRILYMEDGRIVEEGSHDQLIKQNGKYAKMYNIQRSYYNS